MGPTLKYSRGAAPRVPGYPVILHWLVVATILLYLVVDVHAIVRLVLEWDVDRVRGVGRFGGGGLGGALLRLAVLLVLLNALLYVVLFRSIESTRIAMIFYSGLNFIGVPFPLATYLGRSAIGEPASLTRAAALRIVRCDRHHRRTVLPGPAAVGVGRAGNDRSALTAVICDCDEGA